MTYISQFKLPVCYFDIYIYINAAKHNLKCMINFSNIMSATPSYTSSFIFYNTLYFNIVNSWNIINTIVNYN